MSGKIRAIDSVSVTKICSGQVVVDLATAVKELVENSLDAHATTIEIKLRNMGLTSIEVCDNGSGIHPSNYSGLALKHHTSKLTTFDDLQSVSSFGFRGEALNALCELSDNLTVITRRADEVLGTKLSFSPQHGGALTGQVVSPRSVGTTVTVQELFSRLPVRRSDFQRSIKRQFQKLVRVLQGYAIIATGVRLIVTNTQDDGAPGVGKSKASTVIGTQGSHMMSDNIASVFGSKFLQSLVVVECEVDLPADQVDRVVPDRQRTDNSPPERSLSENALPMENGNDRNPDSDGLIKNEIRQQVIVRGFVSKVGAGVGRSDNDRQFVYCNGRPVDLPKFTKVVNEVWRKYEMKHKSACILDVRVPSGWFDVNLAPDKREVIIAGEDVILEALRSQMDAIFAPTQRTFNLSQGNQQGVPAMGILAGGTQGGSSSQVSLLEIYGRSTSGQSPASPLRETKTDSSAPLCAETVWLSPKEQHLLHDTQEHRSRPLSLSPGRRTSQNGAIDLTQSQTQPLLIGEWQVEDKADQSAIALDEMVTPSRMHANRKRKEKPGSDHRNNIISSGISTTQAEDDFESLPPQTQTQTLRMNPINLKPWSFNTVRAFGNSSGTQQVNKKVRTASFPTTNVIDSILPDLISPDAERTLARVLHKDDFARMRVVGQFNLGFIICELRGDLFILDQHACDEKYLFETLQLRTEVHRQPLIAPLTLQCSAAEEMLIVEHMHIFERNGFRFSSLPELSSKNESDEIADLSQTRVGSRLQLIAVPFSKSTQFNHTDVHELASLLAQDSRIGGDFFLGGSENTSGSGNGGVDVSKLLYKNTPLPRINPVVQSQNIDSGAFPENSKNTSEQFPIVPANPAETIVLPKLMQMFASRACRSAVMIGTALSIPQMKKIVKQLQGVIHPWQCPHGRPTMRHMIDLLSLCSE